ncbi:MAG: alpha-glucan family phosphorylase [Deltaproteobacteria bacterium]|nr:alpha-glucan family phosphorylase [Deltaproteobacteria bacterium]
MDLAISSCPPRISRLSELAYNLWWSWHPEARALFAAIDSTLWTMTAHNPVKLLREVKPVRLLTLAQDPAFLRRYDAVMIVFDAALTARDTWFARFAPDLADTTIAYFSAEFGIHNSLPICGGGLGILAGDHCKEASDLGVPLVGVGFMYPQGYFHQRLSVDGRQEAVYEYLDRAEAPLTPAFTPEGKKCLVGVPIDQRHIYVRVWHARVGRVALYLMDTDVEENAPWDRELSARLYGGDLEMRILQEIILGIGGVRVLRALGIAPRVWHLNEGHAAFVTIERTRELVVAGMPFPEAMATVQRTTVFTTHTPVPAGHDAFPFHLVEKYLHGYWNQIGLDRERFLALGYHREPWGEMFHMTVLALHLAGWRNGVSKTHGEVSRRMWQSLWPDTPVEQVPISAVTNGVHTPTWIAQELDQLYGKYLGPDWVKHHDNPALWQRVYDIPDEELWRVRVQLKHKLMSFIRERARQLWREEHRDPVQVLASGALLDPEALTIGFARRFATYKRATLLLQDLARLQTILQDRWRPVQIVFAGKAHPADEPGKHLIHQVYALAKEYGLGGQIAFVEDYDMHVAKFLVQGVDVWLNNPVPPLEASGTSGQKAALNGVPNLSVADGWWCEGYNGGNGWTISSAEPGPEAERRDVHDARTLYQLLESEIVPLYYQRDSDGVPRGWMQVVKEAICSITPLFSARRMVKEYVERFYVPAAREAGAAPM